MKLKEKLKVGDWVAVYGTDRVSKEIGSSWRKTGSVTVIRGDDIYVINESKDRHEFGMWCHRAQCRRLKYKAKQRRLFVLRELIDDLISKNYGKEQISALAPHPFSKQYWVEMVEVRKK